jgi:hypothetical protein
MSTRVLSQKITKARKDHPCDAWAALNDCGFQEDELSPVEWSLFNEGRTIRKGELYLKQTGVSDGVFYTFRGRLELVALCHEREVWDD